MAKTPPKKKVNWAYLNPFTSPKEAGSKVPTPTGKKKKSSLAGWDKALNRENKTRKR